MNNRRDTLLEFLTEIRNRIDGFNNRVDRVNIVLEEIRDRLAGFNVGLEAIQKLEDQREKARVRMKNVRERKSVREQKESESKEGESKEGGKEKFPPHPLIENKGEEKKEPEKKDKENNRGESRAREEGWFEEFWAAYPSIYKFKRSECLNRFKEILASVTTDKGREKLVADILRGLECWKKSYFWTKDGGKFICTPIVWLNNEQWRDKVDSAAEVTSRENATKANQSLMGNIKHGADWRGIRPEDVENVF